MNKTLFGLIILTVIFAFFSCRLPAQIVESEKDDKSEWLYTDYPVTTDVEAAYDINRNGTLEPNETRKLLQERYDIIQTQGSTGVDVDLLQQYDADGDGTIDAREAEEIREDME